MASTRDGTSAMIEALWFRLLVAFQAGLVIGAAGTYLFLKWRKACFYHG